MFAMRWWLWPLVASPVCTEHVQLLQQSLTLRKTSTSTSVSSLAFLQGCSGWDCLKEYVSADDGAFRWHATPHVIRGDGWTGTVLEMTSQRWLPDFVTPDTWNHTLVVITPSNVTEDLCLIYIALGFYGSPQVPSSSVSNLDEDVLAAAEIAIAAGTHAAVLFNVPAEYLSLKKSAYVFSSPLVEDGILSASWAGFKDANGALAPGLLELPMTKATLKAMDTLGEYLKIHSFVLMGTSKRGLLCWNAASVDPRVRGIIPIARPLNLRSVLRLTQRELGGFPISTTLYAEKGEFNVWLGSYLDSPTGQKFLNITDPYFYFSRVASIPKFVISAGNDDFFVPDHWKEWWQEVPGPKWMATVPNSRHIVGGTQERDDLLFAPVATKREGQIFRGMIVEVAVNRSRERLYLVRSADGDCHMNESQARSAMAAWATDLEVRELVPMVSAFLQNLQLPAVTWKLEADGAIVARAADELHPQQVHLWQVQSCDSHRMDFRFLSAKAEVCPCGHATVKGCENQGVEWHKSDLSGHGPWRVRPNATDERWTAFFLSFQFSGGVQVSTEVSVVPRKLPFLCDSMDCEELV